MSEVTCSYILTISSYILFNKITGISLLNNLKDESQSDE